MAALDEYVEALVKASNEWNFQYDVLNRLKDPESIIIERRKLLDLELDQINARSKIVAYVMAERGYVFRNNVWLKIDI